MRRSWLALAIAASLAAGIFIAACSGSEYRHKDYFTQKTGYLEAKDRPQGMSCEDPSVVIQDCNDACSCCYQGQYDGQNSNMDYCVIACDSLLDHENDGDVDPVRADVHAYGECVLGCLSECGGHDATNFCYEECKGYLGID